MRHRRPFPGALLRAAAALCALAALANCGALPGYGTSALDVTMRRAEAGSATGDYAVVALDAASVRAIGQHYRKTLAGHLSGAPHGPSRSTIGPGDQLLVSVWEASVDGLFSTIEKKQADIPAVVDEDGFIYFPYVGRLKAGGISTEALRQRIAEGLEGKAVEPQVKVTLAANNSSNVSVLGNVPAPGLFPLPPDGLRLVELIALSGGAREAPFDTSVTVRRGSRSGTVRLDEALRVPENDIPLAANDVVLLAHEPRSFSAFGAVSVTSLVPFRAESVNLAEALAQVGGLRELTADSGGVFLFRYEEPELAARLGTPLAPAGPEGVPVIYRLDFGEPQAFFLARSFEMRDQDIIYVANHPASEFVRFLAIISPGLGTYNSARYALD